MVGAHLVKVLCKNMNAQKQVLIIHTHTQQQSWQGHRDHLRKQCDDYIITHSFNRNKVIKYTLAVKTFYFSYTEYTMDFSKYLQTQGLSLNTSQLKQYTRNSWQLLYIKSIFPIVLKSSASALSVRSSQQQQKRTAAANAAEGKKTTATEEEKEFTDLAPQKFSCTPSPLLQGAGHNCVLV